jgi:transcriptional regulator with XRE-family HTH domain
MAKVKRRAGDGSAHRQTGARIRLARKHCRLTQEQLADKLGISFQMVQKYENGSSVPTYDRMAEIAIVLSTTPHDLTGWGQKPATNIINFGELLDMATEFAGLLPHYRKVIRRHVRDLLVVQKQNGTHP